MLKRKMLRDIKQNKSQFITIFLMVLIGVMVYVGIEAYMDGMQITADNFYDDYNLQDLNVMGSSFSEADVTTIKNMEHVNDAERKLVINAINADDTDKNFSVSFIESNAIAKFYVVDGIPFDPSQKGVWLDAFYAQENQLKVGDTIRFKYDTVILEEKVLGLINVPDHLYDVKDESQLVPDRKSYGFIYLSVNEFPTEVVKAQAMKELHIDHEELFDQFFPDFATKDRIPFNTIMVDVDGKAYIDQVKSAIEDQVANTLAIVRIEDTLSYSRYQGEIDEGSAYVGIFSGLFLFIAMLSVITTMTRVVKKQRLQIGTLKALGFQKSKITAHYVGYGFWISLFGAIAGMLAGRYFLGSVFIRMEMDFFEIPNGKAIIQPFSYIVAIGVVLCVTLITYVTCRKELTATPAASLRNEMPKVKNGSYCMTAKGVFKRMNFAAKWNLRDMIRNPFRTITGIIGITGCCTLIVCAFGMLNSMNYFIQLQFQDLYNFDYKLVLKENLSDDEISQLASQYGDASSQTIGIEIKDQAGNRVSNQIFVTAAKDYIRFQDNHSHFITIQSDEGVYVTYKLAELNHYELGDTITWHRFGDPTYYESKIVGFNKDPQNQNITMTKSYLESLNIPYTPDSLYTNMDLSNHKEIENIEIVQDIESLKESITDMLSMMKTMILIIIVFAVLLGAVIIYNMGVLSYSEKQYQFATLKVLGFQDKQIQRIYRKQNTWLAIAAILIGLPSGYHLTAWLFRACLDDSFDFGVKIRLSTYLIAAAITIVVSYLVSKQLSKKINRIDMVTSLKGNE